MSHEYLVIFQYHEPEPLQLFERGVIEDYESTTGIFITAASEEEALNWCKAIAQALLCHCNDDRSLDWTRFGYSCWIEPGPGKSTWGHCLDFFQHVQVDEMPDVDAMSTAAYTRWQSKRGA
ncbi:hypothetical protein [Burkholderia multivorans]|uniref:hypothetical protein n=1 Tax=Burkholderia multivorans TaxID=87883 RepID=UPI0019CFE4C7|nr:hypothetical protein [Burkholderia multivorans]MBN6727858.1 hypothetical protein [Burkholderia multivorans]MBN6735443.1 hypothetical protein [Burkholderia multivorans]MBN7126216.1 hypothetical protein [Burkholderia multivorans]MBN8163201.1 hypothetical protein [Burkholderia multivorans]MBN8169400.1 hypothetical protein [Burkholderia multivorans]